MTSSRNRKTFARLEMEVYKLKAKGYLKHISETYDEIHLQMRGPKDTPYHGGVFLINIVLPDEYPFKSPSIGFKTRIFHPNIDEASGSICLDVINQVWTPLYDLITVVEVFLPQLLSYPNPMDPLNTQAAQLYLNDRKNFNVKALEFVNKYTKKVDTDREDHSLSNSDSDLEFDAEMI